MNMKDLVAAVTLAGWAGYLTWRLTRQGYKINRIERWIEVHHPLIPSYASPSEVRERGYWDRTQ